jgi:arylsulfatase A-like enzyme
MTDNAKSILRNSATILFFFAMAGVCIGFIAGLRTVIQNDYFTHGMTEILFWTLANGFNHHLSIFLFLAAGNLFLFFILSIFRVSPTYCVNFGLIPLSVISVLTNYGLPYWHTLRTEPGRLMGKVDVLIFLGLFVLLTLFLILWLVWLRKSVLNLLKGPFNRFFARPTILVTICLIPIIINLFDIADWSDRKGTGRNLILISIDTLRADHLGSYGYYIEMSPNIDNFASEGVRFSRAISQSSWTLPAHASLFTGFYPSSHGAVNKQRSIPPSFLMLGEILRNAGYRSAAFTGGGYLNPKYGFEQGFMDYRHFNRLDSDDVWSFVDGVGERPFFLFLHTYNVHNYYVPPDLMGFISGEFKEDYQELENIMSFVENHLLEDLDEESRRVMEHLHDRYNISILAIDQQFGSFWRGLEEKGLLDNTIVVFFSDHGEEFGEHGRTFHGGTLFNDQVHVPLLMKLPDGIAKRKVVKEVVELMDVFPTVLEYLGLPVPEGIDGQSLVPLIEGEDVSIDGLGFSELSYHITEKYAVCGESMKLVYSPVTENLPLPGNGELEAFKVSWMPGWTETPLALDEENVLAGQFQEWYERMLSESEASSREREIIIDPALRDELKALGYVR